MPTITIDDRHVEVPAEATVLDAARFAKDRASGDARRSTMDAGGAYDA
jgi:hypothetical protein